MGQFMGKQPKDGAGRRISDQGLRSACSTRELQVEQAIQKVSPGALPSAYRRRLMLLAREAIASPPDERLEDTLKGCIAFCYGGGRDWAPHVRVTVYADNPTEHQSNVLVYGTLLRTWGATGFENLSVQCRPIPGTDVKSGYVATSSFWMRNVEVSGQRVLYRDLIHQLLHWFLSLADSDPRKQLLVNIMLQLHEACFNCIGRHKEVFEYCIYDLIDAECGSDLTGRLPPSSAAALPPLCADSESLAGARRVVQRHADLFLDRHKRDVLHATILSPLKFIYQNQYEVFENIDSHGASFWVAILCNSFFPDLEMPFETIVGEDPGWTWGAIDFHAILLRNRDGASAMESLAAENALGGDWRSLTRQLKPPAQGGSSRPLLPGLFPGPALLGAQGFPKAIALAQQPGSNLRKALAPYAERFARFMETPLLLRRFCLAALSSVAWDASLGPALAALSGEAFEQDECVGSDEIRARLCLDCTDATAISLDTKAFAALLRAAGVAWA